MSNKRIVTVQKAAAGAAALGALLAFGRPAHADSSWMGVPDSGLKNPFRLSLGQSYSIYDSEGDSIDPNDYGLHITTLKFDYSFFRHTQHEALISAWATHYKVDYGGSTNTVAFTGEFRWRFGGHGAGYFGLGGGICSEGVYTNGSQPVSTAALGVDLGHFFIETRSLYWTDDRIGLTNVFVGGRF